MSKLRLSPSKFLTWESCPRNFQAVINNEVPNVDSIYSVTGTAAHYVVEQINKGVKLSALDREDMLREKLVALCTEKNVDIEFTKGYKLSKAQIIEYEIPKGWELVSSEQKHVMEFDHFTLSYIIDAVFRDKAGKRYIVDYKTSAQAPKSNLQLYIYAWAEIQRNRIRDIDSVTSLFYMLRNGKRIQAPISQIVYDSTDNYINLSIRTMKTWLLEGKVFPTQGGNCKFCPLYACLDRC